MSKKVSPKGKATNKLQRHPGHKKAETIFLIVVEGEKTAMTKVILIGMKY